MKVQESGAQIMRVAGTTHRRDAIATIAYLPSKRRKVVFESEPTNTHDSKAMRVLVGGIHVGYVPQGTAPKTHLYATVGTCGLEPTPYVWIELN
jgi:hypothetical protein